MTEEFRNKLVVESRGPEIKNRIVGVIGRKGSGKSTLVNEIMRWCRREFTFDTMGEHNWIPDQFIELCEAELYIFEHGQQDGEFQGSYIPETDDLDGELSTICSAAFDAGNMTLVVEELPMMSQPNYVPPRFNKIIRLGRHRALNVLYTGQRAAECPRRVTAATDVFIFFAQTEPNDLNAIAERCDSEVAEKVSQLGEHEFLVWDVSTRSTVIVDNEWYASLLDTQQHYTPAVGAKHGKVLWSLEETET